MSWEISLGAEGWEELQRVLEITNTSLLAEALATVKADQYEAALQDAGDPAFDSFDYGAYVDAQFKEISSLPKDVIVHALMDDLRENGTTEPGGFHVHIGGINSGITVSMNDFNEHEAFRLLAGIMASYKRSPLSPAEMALSFPKVGQISLGSMIAPTDDAGIITPDGLHILRVDLDPRHEWHLAFFKLDLDGKVPEGAEPIPMSQLLDDANLEDEFREKLDAWKHGLPNHEIRGLVNATPFDYSPADESDPCLAF